MAKRGGKRVKRSGSPLWHKYRPQFSKSAEQAQRLSRQREKAIMRDNLLESGTSLEKKRDKAIQTVELSSGPVVTVVVSPESEPVSRTWQIPMALLNYHSTFFAAATRGHFKEGGEDRVHLPDDEPDIFDKFVEWIYSDEWTNTDDLSDHLRVREAAKAWVLGDKLDCRGFRHHAMRKLHHIYSPYSAKVDRYHQKSGIGPQAIEYCCANTLPGSNLRKFFMDVAVTYWGDYSTVHRSRDLQDAWDSVWAEYPEFYDELRERIKESAVQRKRLRAFFD